MISHKHKFIFIHINKTAGTSVVNSLKPFVESYIPRRKRKCVDKHKSINDMLNEETKHYFKFAFVRNSWDRWVSQYHHRIRTNQTNLKNNPISFKEWAKRIHEKDPVYYNVPNELQLRVMSTQLGWIKNKDGEIVTDFIGRFENLQKDFDIICDKIGIPHQQLPHDNSTKHKHYTEYYDDETKQIVEEKFAEDIEYFNFKFGN